MPTCLKKAFVGKRKYISFSILCLLGLLVLYFVTGVIVHAAGITEELQGTSSYEYARLASSYYQLDYYYDAGFLGGLTEGVFYVFHGLTKLIWGLVLIFTYFVISIVREAYSLDIFTTFSDMITTFIQRVVGVDSSGVKNNGLLYAFLALVIVIVAIYMAYQGFAKKSGSKAFGALSNMVIMFIITVVFIGFSPTLLSNITSFSKEVNTMVLSAGTNTFTSGEVTAEESPEYLSDSIWQVLVKNPWLILEFGSTDVEQSRVDSILANDKDTDARQEIVKNEEVGTRENKVMSADGLWDRLGNSFLILLVDLIVCYFVLMLVVTMLMYDFMFLLYVSMSPFVLVFSMFPNSGNSFTRYVLKLFNLLMAKAAILFLMTLAFSLSTMVYQQFSDKSFLFIAFLQIVIYLSVYLNLHKLTALAGIHSKDGTEGISTVDRKVNRGLRKAGRTAGAFIAGNTVGRLSSAMKQRKNNKANEKERETQETLKQEKSSQENQPNQNTKQRQNSHSNSVPIKQNEAYDLIADNPTFANNEKQRSPDADKEVKEDSKQKPVKEKDLVSNIDNQLEILKKRRSEGANVKKRNPNKENSTVNPLEKNISTTNTPLNEKKRAENQLTVKDTTLPTGINEKKRQEKSLKADTSSINNSANDALKSKQASHTLSRQPSNEKTRTATIHSKVVNTSTGRKDIAKNSAQINRPSKLEKPDTRVVYKRETPKQRDTHREK